MDIRFRNPGYAHMIDSIMEHQQDDTTAYWNDALFYFYPNLDKAHAYALSPDARKTYFREALKAVYEEKLPEIEEKVQRYQAHWDKHRTQIAAAFSEAFGVDCEAMFNDIVCNVTLNPVCPRFLTARYFDLFYMNSERGAVGMAIHELIHFVWFAVWHDLFGDSYAEYETPSLKWILSELVVESIMDDERLSSINPYYPRERGGCIYSYFFTMELDGKPVTQTMREMYREMDMRAFMQASYAYMQRHEAAIRAHIAKAEETWA